MLRMATAARMAMVMVNLPEGCSRPGREVFEDDELATVRDESVHCAPGISVPPRPRMGCLPAHTSPSRRQRDLAGPLGLGSCPWRRRSPWPPVALSGPSPRGLLPPLAGGLRG